jgi:hypothetical protein
MIRSKTDQPGRYSEFVESISRELRKLRPGKNRDSLKKGINGALDRLVKIAERIPARSRWRGIVSKAKAALRALAPLIKRVRELNAELHTDDQKYKKEKKSGNTHPKFYDTELDNLSQLAAKLDDHATLTTGHDPRMNELKYECAKEAYALMVEYSSQKPSRAREGKFQTIAWHFFCAVGNGGGANGGSMERACNRVLREHT